MTTTTRRTPVKRVKYIKTPEGAFGWQDEEDDFCLIGAVYKERALAVKLDVNNRPVRVKGGWWAHWEIYEGKQTGFGDADRVKPSLVPSRVRDDILDVKAECDWRKREEEAMEEWLAEADE